MKNKSKIIMGILLSITILNFTSAVAGQVFADPDLNSTTMFLDQVCYINSLTDTGNGGILGIVMLIIIFGALFMTLKSFKLESALPVASLITAFLGILLRFIPCMINDYVLYVCIILVVYSIYLLFKEAANYET